METSFSYTSPEWRALAARALERDQHRCTVSRFIGGECSERLHAHHLIPVAEEPARALDIDNVVTACSAHHPRLEALRRYVMRYRAPRCRHHHPYPQGRIECERRLAQQGA